MKHLRYQLQDADNDKELLKSKIEANKKAFEGQQAGRNKRYEEQEDVRLQLKLSNRKLEELQSRRIEKRKEVQEVVSPLFINPIQSNLRILTQPGKDLSHKSLQRVRKNLRDLVSKTKFVAAAYKTVLKKIESLKESMRSFGRAIGQIATREGQGITSLDLKKFREVR